MLSLQTVDYALSGPAAETSGAEKHPHIRFLDGARGLAALYVVLFHILEIVYEPNQATLQSLQKKLFFLRYGHYAVDVFIVLSGFSLMLTVVRSGELKLKGGASGYLTRRARRILPPYYAAIGLTILLMCFMPKAWLSPKLSPLTTAETFTVGSVVSHLFMAQNFSSRWLLSLDAPTWSVATEWQIYFVFPLILLPIWRRFGNTATALAGCLIGVAPFLIVPDLKSAYFWYIGLFAFGMIAATQTADISRGRYWGTLGLILGAILLALSKISGVQKTNLICLVDFVCGGAVASGILYLFRATGGKNVLLMALESRPAVSLGHFSYSLYLTHYPIICVVYIAAYQAGIRPMTILIIEFTVGLALSLIGAWLFYLAIEKRFTASSTKRRSQ